MHPKHLFVKVSPFLMEEEGTKSVKKDACLLIFLPDKDTPDTLRFGGGRGGR